MRLATVIPIALTLAACNPVYAPPIRAVQYGAPARLTEGRVEIGGTAGGLAIPNVGGPHLAIGIRDWVAIEAGGNLQLAGGGQDRWAMGFIGPRFSFAPHRERKVHLIADLELGVGAGVGGRNDPARTAEPTHNGSIDGLDWTDRIAWGGYQGGGVGVQAAWFSFYGRVRLEESTSTNIPTTFWPSVSIGLEANIKQRASLTLGAGYLGYYNGQDSATGWFWQIGVTVFADAFARHDARPAEPTPPRPPVYAPQPPAPEPSPVEPEEGEEPDEPQPGA